MKKKWISLMTMSMLLLTGCGEDSSSIPDSVDNRDSQIVAVYDAYKANGGTLDYDTWLSTIKGEKGDTGSKGDDGSSLISGKGVPFSDIGHDGDSYVDTDTWDYYIKNRGSWVLNGNIKGSKGDTGEKGNAGQDGRSVVSITKTSTDGNVDTYTITYSDGTTSTFEVTNGQNGEQGIQGNPGEDGHTPTISIGENGNWYIDGVDSGTKAQGSKGDKGDKGDTGAQGPKGDKGDAGEAGAQGPKGDKGDKGEDAITYVPVIFNNWDGTKLYEFYFEKGTDAVYEGETPTHPDTTEDGKTFQWTFKGWDKNLTNIQKPTIFTAVFQGPVSCKFVNYDGTELYSTKIAMGENVSYEGSIPTKPSEVSGDQTIDWTFSGWDKSLYGVMEDTVFTAQFNAPNAIKCTFKNEDGTVLGIQYVGKNSKVIYEGETPKKDEVNHGDGTITKYSFEGWDKSTKNLTSDTVFTATFSETTYYECKFYDEDGTLLYTTSTFAGGTVEYKGKTPTREQEANGTIITDYTFRSWDKALGDISEPTVFMPVFTFKKFIGYKVTFVDSKNPDFNYSHYYQENTYARNPYANYWSYDNDEVTLFMGWDKDISSVTQEITTNAVYKTISRGQNGEYPQDKVTNDTLIAALNNVTETDGNGYYEYQGERYSRIGRGETWDSYRYFKVSPIQWRYLSQSNGKSLFISEYILVRHVWNETEHEEGIYQNNYKYSDIRKWLNSDFLDTAFSDDSLIETTVVDNSISSTGYDSNPYVCETTNDKVFLLSVAEAIDFINGFSIDRGKDVNRVAFTTDYSSVIKGGESYFWSLRSPRDDYDDFAYNISEDGSLTDRYGVGGNHGIRPALAFRI